MSLDPQSWLKGKVLYKYKTPYLDLGKQVRRVPDDSGGGLVSGGALGHDGPGGDDDAAVDGREGGVVLEVVAVAEGLVPLGRDHAHMTFANSSDFYPQTLPTNLSVVCY